MSEGAIQPIETVYAGCRFRSRLEARWAVFFDTLGVTWDYEPEGFRLPSGRRYLPDFWLPEAGCWYEVKGATPTEDERALLVEFASCLPALRPPIHRPRSEAELASAQYLKVAVGEIPRRWAAVSEGTFIEPEIPPLWSQGWVWRVLPNCGDVQVAARWWNRCSRGHAWVGWGWCWRCMASDADCDWHEQAWRMSPAVGDAARAARAARFEHGEIGGVR